jgi:hypothetical protein
LRAPEKPQALDAVQGGSLQVKSWKQQADEGLGVLLRAKDNCVCVVPSPCQRPKIPGGTSAEAEENGDGTDTAGKEEQRKKKIEKEIAEHTAVLYAVDNIAISECRDLVQETILMNVGDASVSVAALQVLSNSDTQEPAQHGCTCNSIPAFQD